MLLERPPSDGIRRNVEFSLPLGITEMLQHLVRNGSNSHQIIEEALDLWLEKEGHPSWEDARAGWHPGLKRR